MGGVINLGGLPSAANVRVFSLLILTKKCKNARSQSAFVCGAVVR